MSRQDFVDQLTALRFKPSQPGGNRVAFPYEVEVGKFSGRQIQLGFVVPDDFPFNPPSGPHLLPPLLALHPQNDVPHPVGGVHPSEPFGSDWQYWSRPFQDWKNTDRSVRVYMAYIRKLFDTQ
ncbi:MAG TPA: hypothetical protein VK797_22005 [Tepidisphaeraceae bacterium]|jgi:hypothetical protein|nr:hypothetical protein [Tepidisphaeraceae bacterium]